MAKIKRFPPNHETKKFYNSLIPIGVLILTLVLTSYFFGSYQWAKYIIALLIVAIFFVMTLNFTYEVFNNRNPFYPIMWRRFGDKTWRIPKLKGSTDTVFAVIALTFWWINLILLALLLLIGFYKGYI